ISPEGFRVVEGGEGVDVIETDHRGVACMLGGPERRTLFMLTSQHSLAVEASVRRTGNVLITEVATPGAGLP
ncbi:MAG: SMP-30/gluconolactonase/LRE family protein, partial [Ilumatobacteraceae bacterium]